MENKYYHPKYINECEGLRNYFKLKTSGIAIQDLSHETSEPPTKFYDNWYFYTEYKEKSKDSFPFEIKYVSL